MSKPKLDTKVINILAERFNISPEQAKNLYIAYFLSGSCDEGIIGAYHSLNEDPNSKISLQLIMQVFYSLDDLYRIVEEDNEKLRKWWKTGKM